MSDLTDRLRCFDRQTTTEAADEIERLRKVNADLKSSLRDILDIRDGTTGSEYSAILARGYAAIAKAGAPA